jgi:hypothetical protein
MKCWLRVCFVPDWSQGAAGVFIPAFVEAPNLSKPASRGRRRNADSYWRSKISHKVNTIGLGLSNRDATVKGLVGGCLHIPQEFRDTRQLQDIFLQASETSMMTPGCYEALMTPSCPYRQLLCTPGCATTSSHPSSPYPMCCHGRRDSVRWLSSDLPQSEVFVPWQRKSIFVP